MLEHLNFPFFYTWGFLLAIFKAKFQHGNSNFKLMKMAFECRVAKWEIPLWRQNFGKTPSFDARQAARRSTQTWCISSLLSLTNIHNHSPSGTPQVGTNYVQAFRFRQVMDYNFVELSLWWWITRIEPYLILLFHISHACLVCWSWHGS